MFNFSKKDIKKLDFVLLLTLISLIAYGLVVLSSAISPTKDSIKSQVFATFIGFMSMLFIFTLDLSFLKKIKWILYVISIGLLIATILFGHGGKEWGANLWLKIGPINLQPSEISKVLHIIFLSAYLGDNKKKINTVKFIIKYLFFGLLPVALIILQKDIGTAMVVFFITMVIFFISGISWKNIGIIFAIGVLTFLISLPFIWSKLDGYAKNRILDFQNSDRNLSTSTHQTDRGLIALGSGQLTGRGYKSGPFSQNKYIPEQHTDFIFPVLVEDFGFIGGFVAIFLYFMLFYRMIRVSMRTDEVYHVGMVIGVLALLFIHIFENMGMTMGIMPVTGIPLPFFSNGGTFQMMNISLMGIVLSVSMHKKSLEF